MKLTRRTLLSAGGAAVVGGVFLKPAFAAAEYTYKFANGLTPSHPVNVRLAEAASRILEESGGRMQINIFPAGQLGNDMDTLSQVRSGGTEFFIMSPISLSTLVPNVAISSIGFAFHDYATVWRSMDGPLGAYSRSQIAQKGLIAMDAMWDNGFRQITTAKTSINTPEDLSGFKIRVPPSPLWQLMFSAFGAAPATISWAETYTALSTGIVDGQENPLAIISTAKIYEVQKHCAVTNHVWDGFWLLGNKRAWNALPEGLQEICARNFNMSASQQRADSEKLNASLREELTSKGMAFTDPDPKAFREVLNRAGFYAECKGKLGEEAWTLLEEAVGADLG